MEQAPDWRAGSGAVGLELVESIAAFSIGGSVGFLACAHVSVCACLLGSCA